MKFKVKEAGIRIEIEKNVTIKFHGMCKESNTVKTIIRVDFLFFLFRISQEFSFFILLFSPWNIENEYFKGLLWAIIGVNSQKKANFKVYVIPDPR